MHCNSALAETAASTYPGLTACDGHEVLVKFRPKPQLNQSYLICEMLSPSSPLSGH
ncbi:hypothetical protein CUJ84_pRLN2000102 (plasmid) [Rhizobium leguminosarum]|uniref:Uncharacterized protein n=1 Tax=Rhizobium leguminosarum TaxID=384 RepID=A0A2K9ZEI8_RHILE|nr:hypothetical protein CUJ84_pRLN2000102 [Rhizobium leguminosarum]